jgi:NADH:ubiquinone oxidoreductase subunit B-like Fe-S oxidoreductase
MTRPSTEQDTQDGPGMVEGARPRARIHPATRPLILDLGCCGVSALHIGAAGYDLPGFDGAAYDLEPYQANALIVAGRVPGALVPFIHAVYEQLAAPRWVIAYGVCAISGAVLDTQSVAQILPVDLSVPGCPPHTRALWHALSRLPRRREP